MLKSLVAKIATYLGYSLMSTWQTRRNHQYQTILEKIVLRESIPAPSGEAIVVFSKDRAMQLDALLASYYAFVKNPRPIYVLFYASSSTYKEGYELLKEKWQEKAVHFIQETNFKQDLLKLMGDLTCGKLCFLVDDISFKSTVDLDDFFTVNPKKYVASLRMGEHLTYAYTVQQKQALPPFKKSSNHPEMLSWEIKEGELDWNYPLSVDGHLFDYFEMRVMIEELSYSAPNSFEEALQIMNPLFQQRQGLCYTTSKIINNPCNKVQVENDNIAGNITVKELNDKWLSGYRINFEKYKDLKNESAHQELAIEFVKR